MSSNLGEQRQAQKLKMVKNQKTKNYDQVHIIAADYGNKKV